MFLPGGYMSFSNVADIFDATTGTWTTATLSEGRGWFDATSLESAGVAIFAGGCGTLRFDLIFHARDGL
jgi:hypothetical protein